MNNMTRLKVALDKALGGGVESESKFRIVRRSFDESKGLHVLSIMYTYREKNSIPVTPIRRERDRPSTRLFDEIMRAKKVRSAK